MTNRNDICYDKRVTMNTAKKRYDSKHKLTRILLDDYLVLKRISQAADISMAEALHRLIEHQAQLPLPELRVTGIPVPVFRAAPVTSIAVNGAGAKHSAFKIKPKGGVIRE